MKRRRATLVPFVRVFWRIYLIEEVIMGLLRVLRVRVRVRRKWEAGRTLFGGMRSRRFLETNVMEMRAAGAVRD